MCKSTGGEVRAAYKGRNVVLVLIEGVGRLAFRSERCIRAIGRASEVVNAPGPVVVQAADTEGVLEGIGNLRVPCVDGG